jgi:hypothetical protein
MNAAECGGKTGAFVEGLPSCLIVKIHNLHPLLIRQDCLFYAFVWLLRKPKSRKEGLDFVVTLPSTLFVSKYWNCFKASSLQGHE